MVTLSINRLILQGEIGGAFFTTLIHASLFSAAVVDKLQGYIGGACVQPGHRCLSLDAVCLGGLCTCPTGFTVNDQACGKAHIPNASLISPRFFEEKKGIMCYHSPSGRLLVHPSIRPAAVYQYLLLHY